MRRVFRVSVLAGVVPALALVGLGAFWACGGESDGDGDTDGDSDADVQADCTGDTAGDGAEQTFIIDSLGIGGEDVGFNLDGVVTPDECEDDMCRSGLPDGPGGIDNRLGPILEEISESVTSFDANQAMEDAIIEGSMLILLRMIDVDDWQDDSCVSLNFYVGHDPQDPPAVEEGRTYDVDSRSLAGSGTDIDDPVIDFDRNCVIHEGVFHGGPSDFGYTFPLNDETDLTLNVTDAQVQWTASAQSVTGGVLGGYVTIHDLLGAMANIDEARDFLRTIATVMENQADIDSIPAGTEIATTSCTEENVAGFDADGQGCGHRSYGCSASGHCIEPESHFDAISLALVFTAVPAELGSVFTEEPADGDADSDVDSDVDSDADADGSADAD